MAGVLSTTETPPFDIMGLILGGRGYASSWFQNRDKMRLLDAAAAKELADRQAYTKGVLASPELSAQIANPYDRRANWNLWGQLASGPESMVPFANTQTNQATGAIYDREQAQLQSGLAAANIKLSADEQLRVMQRTKDAENEQRNGMLQFLFSPNPENGMTPVQQQTARNMVGDMLGIKPQPGYSIAEGGAGFEPTIGGTVWEKMMDEGQASQRLVSGGEQLLEMLKTGQVNANQWEVIKADMMMADKTLETLGSFDSGLQAFFNTVIPDYSRWKPDLTNKYADALETNLKIWKFRQQGLAEKYRVPIDTVTGGGKGPFDVKRLSKEEENKRFGNPVEAPASTELPPVPSQPPTGRIGRGGGYF